MQARNTHDVSWLHKVLRHYYGAVVVGSPKWMRIIKEELQWMNSIDDDLLADIGFNKDYSEYINTLRAEYKFLFGE